MPGHSAGYQTRREHRQTCLSVPRRALEFSYVSRGLRASLWVRPKGLVVVPSYPDVRMTRHSAPASSGQLAASPTKREADFFTSWTGASSPFCSRRFASGSRSLVRDAVLEAQRAKLARLGPAEVFNVVVSPTRWAGIGLVPPRLRRILAADAGFAEHFADMS